MNNALYIPLDNRPVCYKRVNLLLSSVGFNVITPEENLIKTVLDNQPFENYPHGDIYKLYDWYKKLDHSNITYYIISIDQITSGGLVNSRLDEDYTYDQNIEMIDKYLDEQILKNKKVILIDSLDRLAITCSYRGYDLKDYAATRAYASNSRIFASTKDDIFKSYDIDKDGNYIDPKKYNLDLNLKEKYINNRIRKFNLNEYIINKVKTLRQKGFDIYYMLGIDDSLPTTTIQTNEINYFNNMITTDMGLVFIGIDELPLMSVARLTKEVYKNSDVKLKLYYVGSHEKEIGDPFDVGTIEEDMASHLKVLEAQIDDVNPDIHVVMLTCDKNQEIQKENINQAITIINKLIKEEKLVIVMDMMNCMRYGPFEKELIDKVELSKILSYSNWNTIANIIGISLSCGIARFYYLKKNKSTNLSNDSYTTLLTFTYLKDLAYKAQYLSQFNKYINEQASNKQAYLNFYTDLDRLPNLNEYTKDTLHSINDRILNNLYSSKYISNIDPITYDIFPKYEIVDYNFIWYRAFECDINLKKEQL